MMSGGQSVTVSLEERMLGWLVNSWKDFRGMVGLIEAFSFCVCTSVHFNPCIINLGAVALLQHQFGSAVGPIFLDQLVCSGSETSLLECQSYTPLGLSTCQHSQDVGVRCVGKILEK